MRTIVIFVLVAIILLIAVFGLIRRDEQASKTQERAEEMLPPGTVVKEVLGNGWYVVEIKDKLYIYRYRKAGTGRTEVLTLCE